MKFSSLVTKFFFLQILVTFGYCDLNSDIQLAESKSRSLVQHRKKRYVIFPEGSTLSIAACISPAALAGDGTIFTSGIAWAISYDLPNETIHTKHKRHEFPMTLQRRKRDLFVRMEKLIDSSGFDGKNCVLKTICESTRNLVPRRGVWEEILRLIFAYPPEEKYDIYDRGGKIYGKAHVAGELNENCDQLFPCPVSFLKMGLAFGRNS